MYNRYIPQPDGSYRRNRMPETKKAPPQQRQHTPPEPEPCHESPCAPLPPSHKEPICRQDSGVTGFLRQLLPKEFDTGDLFIVLLLLLMAGDSQEEQNTALLTLALYFFM